MVIDTITVVKTFRKLAQMCRLKWHKTEKLGESSWSKMLLNVEEIEWGLEGRSREELVIQNGLTLLVQNGNELYVSVVQHCHVPISVCVLYPVLGDVFWGFFFLLPLALSLMLILKSLVTMETISWAARQGAAVRDLYTLMSACVLHTCVYVLMYICGVGGKRGKRREELILWINPSVFCMDAASPVLIISVQILVQSFT